MSAQKGNTLVLILAAVALLSLAATGYLFWQNQQSSETSSWKTYTNEKFAFQFKYPNNLYIDPEQETDRSVVLLNNNYKDRSSKLDQPFISVNIGKGNIKEALETVQKLERESGNKILADTKPITIDGYQGYRYEKIDSGNAQLGIDIQKGDYIYGFLFFNTSKTVNQEDINSMSQTFDQILSTFQFAK